MGTRLRVGRVGQETGFARIRVDLEGEEATIFPALLAAAATKLEVGLPASVEHVRMYLSGGDPLDEPSILEKDDTVWIAFDGGTWCEPGVTGTADTASMPSGLAGSSEDASAGTSVASSTMRNFQPQRSIGSFFGRGLKRTWEETASGKWEESSRLMTEEELSATPKSTAGACSKGCGRLFSHAPARVHHEKTCKGGTSNAAARIASGTAAASAAVASASAGVSAADEADASPEARAKAPKLRKDLQPKQSGLREGEKRGISHTTYFKYEVVKTFRRFESLAKRGLCPMGPGKATSEFYNDLSESNITRWKEQEDGLRGSLIHESRVDQSQSKKSGGKLASSFSSKGARRMTLHPGRPGQFGACEVELHALYRRRRRGDSEGTTSSSAQRGGERVSGQWLRIQMKRLVRKHCGDHAVAGFKASKWWLRNFARRFGISLRRKSNSRSAQTRDMSADMSAD